MYNLASNFKEVKEVVNRDFKDYANIEYIQRGNEHFVAIINNKYVARFPRTIDTAKKAYYSSSLLSRFKPIPLKVPVTLYIKEEPLYFVTEYIDGVHLSPTQIKSLSLDNKKDFAFMYADFASSLHKFFNVNKEQIIRQQMGLINNELSWQDYFHKTVNKRTFPTQIQNKYAKQYYNIWHANIGSLPPVVLHDDMHLENILFKNNKLIGVLDFGDSNIGYPEQDFRQLYKLGEDILDFAVSRYNLISGKKINIQSVKYWAIMQQLASYSERLATNSTGHPAFKRACDDLNIWLPVGRWGKL